MAFYFSYDAPQIDDLLENRLNLKERNKLYKKEQFHCTMLYSHDTYKEESISLHYSNTTAVIEGFSVWDTGNGYVLVARINNPLLYEIHNNMGIQIMWLNCCEL